MRARLEMPSWLAKFPFLEGPQGARALRGLKHQHEGEIMKVESASTLRKIGHDEARRMCAHRACFEWGTWMLVVWNDAMSWTGGIVFCDQHAQAAGIPKGKL